MGIIKTVRNIKATVKAPPSKKVKLYVKTNEKTTIKQGAIYIEKLANVSGIEFIEDKAQLTEKTMSQVLDGFEIYIPLGELVDTDKEIERLNGEIKKVEQEIARASGKLSNAGFLAKAPKNLVNEEREKLNSYLEIRSKLEKELKELM